MSEGKASTGRGDRLDGLQLGRGIAATMVALDHAILHNLPFRPAFVPMLGVYGVTLFFIISGFIMVKVTGEGTFAPGRFLLRRIQRIAPLYYVACAILALQVLIAPWAFKSTQLEFWHVLKSLFFIPAYSPTVGVGAIKPFYQLGWTLNFEMFFYVVFALLFFLRSAQRVWVMTLLFTGLMILGQTVHFDQAAPAFYTRTNLASFLVGAWLGLWSQRGEIRIGKWLAIALFALSLGMIGYVLAHLTSYSRSVSIRFLVLAAVSLHIAILVGYFDRLRKPIHRFLLLLGDASYSIYLFHMFAVGPIAFIGKKLGPDFVIPSIIAACFGGVLAGLIAYHLIEKPIMDWFKRRRTTARDPGQPTVADAAIVPATGQTLR